MSHWTDKLVAMQPCHDGLAWARRFPTAQAAWDACADPEWMCWLLGKTGADKRDMTLLACQFARLALPYANGDEAELTIATAEQWAHGDEEVTDEDVRNAATRATAASTRANGLDSHAWAVDWSSATAACADAAAAALASVSTRVVTLRKCCAIIRQFYPEVPL